MAKKKGTRQKKADTRVDFTPMVDMNMLLITFFMLCTTLIKPQTMELSMPSNEKDLTDDQKSKVKASQAITLLLADNDKLYYYEGEPNYQDYTSLKETSYDADGLRAFLLQRNESAVRQVNLLKKQKTDLLISEEEYDKKLAEIKSGKDTPTVNTERSREMASELSELWMERYKDEMLVCQIGKYVITDIVEGDEFLLKNYETQGGLTKQITMN